VIRLLQKYVSESVKQYCAKQESCDIAKMTARCALYMSALKVNPNLGEEEVIGGRRWYHLKEHW